MAAHKSPGLDWGLQPLRSGSIPDIRAYFGYWFAWKNGTRMNADGADKTERIGNLLRKLIWLEFGNEMQITGCGGFQPPLYKRLKTAWPDGILYGCSVQAAHRLSVPDWGFQPLRPGSIPGARAGFGYSGVWRFWIANLI